MKISTRGRYGLRAMLDLCVNSLGEHISLKTLAEMQNISENYLEQVFSILRKAELVKSVKGPQGGYVLAKAPSLITVGDILRALEGNLSVAYDKEENLDDKAEVCISNMVWKKINESINAAVDSVTLEDLSTEYKKLIGNSSYMFYI